MSPVLLLQSGRWLIQPLIGRMMAKEETETMSKKALIKNIALSRAQILSDRADCEERQNLSQTPAQNKEISITLFAFDAGEGLSPHPVSGEAMVYMLDDEAFITIDGKGMTAKIGEVVVMPADIPPLLDARQRFKILLTVVKQPKEQ